MKWLFFLLLLANLAFAAYLQWVPKNNPDAKLMVMQMNADKIKILTPQQVASLSAPQAAKPAAAPPAAACVEWGDFSGKETASAAAALANLQLGDKLGQREFAESVGYWIYIPPLRTKAEAEKKIAELNKLGVEGYFLVQESGQWYNAISLGVFKTEDAAKAFLAKLQEKGVKSAKIGARAGQVKQTVFVVRDPGDAVTAKLVELKQEFAGSEVKAVECGAPAAEKK